jgi:hypothetical protein
MKVMCSLCQPFRFAAANAHSKVNNVDADRTEAANRASGWNTWLTFAISEAPPESTVTPTRHLLTK